MSNAKKFSSAAGSWIEKHSGEKSEKEMKIIRYGLEVLYLNIIKTIVLLSCAYFMGIIKYTLVAALTFSLARIFGFGMHAKSTWGCYVATGSIYIGIPLVMKSIHLGIIFRIFLIILMFIGLWLYAPADTEQRPILGEKKRFRFKIKAIILMGTLAGFSFAVPQIYGDIMILSLIGEIIMILPITYKLFSRGYRNYETYECTIKCSEQSC